MSLRALLFQILRMSLIGSQLYSAQLLCQSLSLIEVVFVLQGYIVCFQCDPNMAVYAVWINTLDPRLPRLALFAKRDICKDEELTFDYMMTGQQAGRFWKAKTKTN